MRPSTDPRYKPGTTVAFVARCLCNAGAKLGHGTRIDEVLTPEEIAAMWPDGRPSTIDALRDKLRHAGIPEACLGWSLDTFAAHVQGPASRLKRAADWSATPLDKRQDIVMFGPNGTGKTGMAVALARTAVERGENVRYLDTRKFYMHWQQSFGMGATEDEHDIYAHYAALDILVLDEFTATVPTVKQADFFRLVLDSRQKDLRPTVIVCNVDHDIPAGEIAGTLSEIFGPVVYDRLRERSQFWAISGPSQRRTRF